MSPAERHALRQRRYLQRQRNGKIVLRIAVDHVDLVEALVADGLIADHEQDDRRAIERAVEIVVAGAIKLSMMRHWPDQE
jgi:hypothetical protein